MPEVSVLMPSYNHEMYVGEAIESVLGQTWTDLELVIVDDASTDRSPDIIRQYQAKDNRIRAHFRRTNADHTNNTAIDLARGKYITFCDSDDLCVVDRIEKQLAAIREKGNENKVVIADAVNIDVNGNTLGSIFFRNPEREKRLRQENKNGDIFENLFQHFELHFCRQTMFLKRENLSGIRFDENLWCAGEFKFAAQLAYRYQYHWIDDVVYKHRIHGGGATTNWDQDKARQDRASMAKEFLEPPYDKRISPVNQTRQCERIVYNALIGGDLHDVRKYTLRLLSINPSLSRSIKEEVRARGRSMSDLVVKLGDKSIGMGDAGITLADLP